MSDDTRPTTPLRTWHEIVRTRDLGGLEGLLADDVVFRSPAVHRPHEGKAPATAYLSAAIAVLGPTLTYRHEWSDSTSAVLEFTATLDGLEVHGVDLLAWGEDGRIREFTVMVRPLRGLEALIAHMRAALEAGRPE